MIERATYSAKEVAELLGLSLSSVYSAARCGLLPCIAVGARRRVFPRAAVARLLEGGGQLNPESFENKKDPTLVRAPG